MSTISIDIDVSDISEALNKVIRKMEFKEPIQDSLKILHSEANDNFEQQGALYQGGGFIRSGGKTTTRGKAWAPLADATRKQRKRLGYKPARPILIRSGKLKKGFKTSVINDTQGKIQNTVWYGKFHQSGGKYLPQRKIIGTTEKSRKAIALVFSNHLADIIKELRK